MEQDYFDTVHIILNKINSNRLILATLRSQDATDLLSEDLALVSSQ